MVTLDPQLELERFDYVPCGSAWAVARLMLNLGPADHARTIGTARLAVQSRIAPTRPFASGLPQLERRLSIGPSSAAASVWQTAFALPLGVVEDPDALYALELDGVHALDLPIPYLRPSIRVLQLATPREPRRPVLSSPKARLATVASIAAGLPLATAVSASAKAATSGTTTPSATPTPQAQSTSTTATTAATTPAVATSSQTTPAATTTPAVTTTPAATTSSVAATTPAAATAPAATTTQSTASVPEQAPATTSTPTASSTTASTTSTSTHATAPAVKQAAAGLAGVTSVTIPSSTRTHRHSTGSTATHVHHQLPSPAAGAPVTAPITAAAPTGPTTTSTVATTQQKAERGAAAARRLAARRQAAAQRRMREHREQLRAIAKATSIQHRREQLAVQRQQQAAHARELAAQHAPSNAAGGGAQSGTGAPGYTGPTSWTGVVASNPGLTEVLRNLSGQASDVDQPPAFLIPIYMQAARRYHVPWEVLAAINSIESDYGRDLSTSSAGAIGWMQFEPGTWKEYALAVDGASEPNPYDPRDAIFAAAKYLAAAGAAQNIETAVFAYNHANWYVDEVMQRARAIAEHVGYQSAKVGRDGTITVDFATTLKTRPLVRYSGGLLSHYDRLIAAANMVSAANFPYLWGGGHEQPSRFGPFDCSGSVSYVMQQAGYRVPTTVSGDISSWHLPAGPGQVTIFYNSVHTFMRIGNRFFGTSGFARPGGGAGWFDVDRLPASYLAEFHEAHVPRLGSDSFSASARLPMRTDPFSLAFVQRLLADANVTLLAQARTNTKQMLETRFRYLSAGQTTPAAEGPDWQAVGWLGRWGE